MIARSFEVRGDAIGQPSVEAIIDNSVVNLMLGGTMGLDSNLMLGGTISLDFSAFEDVERVYFRYYGTDNWVQRITRIILTDERTIDTTMDGIGRIALTYYSQFSVRFEIDNGVIVLGGMHNYWIFEDLVLTDAIAEFIIAEYTCTENHFDDLRFDGIDYDINFDNIEQIIDEVRALITARLE